MTNPFNKGLFIDTVIGKMDLYRARSCQSLVSGISFSHLSQPCSGNPLFARRILAKTAMPVAMLFVF
jgi:hypothetical protein